MLATSDMGTNIVPTKASADAARASKRDRLFAMISARPLKAVTKEADFSFIYRSCSSRNWKSGIGFVQAAADDPCQALQDLSDRHIALMLRWKSAILL